MTPIIFLGLTILIPVILTFALRVNAAVVFMSLCVGEVLVQYVANDAASFVTMSSRTSQLSESTVSIVVLLLPVVLTLIFMFHSVNGVKLALNIIPALCAGLLAALLIKPLLSVGFQNIFEKSSLGSHFLQAQTLIVSLSALISLLFLWFQRHGNHTPHGRGAKH